MNETPLSEDALMWACSRMVDFAMVQKHREWDEKVEAMSILRESLGISDDVLSHFTIWSDHFMGTEEYTPAMLIAFLLGVMAVRHEYES